MVLIWILNSGDWRFSAKQNEGEKYVVIRYIRVEKPYNLGRLTILFFMFRSEVFIIDVVLYDWLVGGDTVGFGA
jgi:hypothetical protein